MKILIENPSGTTLKKEFDEKSRQWKTVGNLAVPYPYPYGFIPSTMQKDGDPLDALLLTNKPSEIKTGDVLDISVLGLVEYFEDEKRDFKILTRKISEDIQITEQAKSRIKSFLLHAFDNKPGKKVKFGGFYGIEKAEKEIEECQLNH